MKKIGVGLAVIAASIGTPVLAADMAVAPAPVAAPYSWTGIYAGGNVGYSWGRLAYNYALTNPGTFAGTAAASGSANLDGGLGGGQVGGNWQIGNLVLGVEGDLQASDERASSSTSTAVSTIGAGTLNIGFGYSARFDWIGTLRGRLGYAVDRWLFYTTGGMAFDSATPANSVGRTGWTVGGGIEWAFTNRWSVKVEYLYLDYGTTSTTVSGTTPTIYTLISSARVTDNVARAGINFHF